MTNTKHIDLKEAVWDYCVKSAREEAWSRDELYTIIDTCLTNHTDSVEAIMKEFERRMPLITSHGLLLEARLTPTNYQKMKHWLREKLTTLQATSSQQVEEAVRKERERLFEEIREFTFEAQPYEGTMIRVWLNNYTPNHQD